MKFKENSEFHVKEYEKINNGVLKLSNNMDRYFGQLAGKRHLHDNIRKSANKGNRKKWF